MKLPLESIRTDLGTQMRPTLNQEYIAELAELVQEGNNLPLIEVYHDGQVYVLTDGFHRLEAYARLKAREIEAEVHQGSLRDALLRAAQVNEAHGLRRDRETKRKAVMTLLGDEEWRQWSDREIARQTLTSHEFVRQVRQSLTPASSSIVNVDNAPSIQPPRKTSDGRSYPARQKSKKEPIEPSLEHLEKTASKPLSVQALCGVIVDWASTNRLDMPAQEALIAVLDGESPAVESLENYLRSTRAVTFNWPDVLEAAELVRSRMAPERYGNAEEKPPVEGLETLEDFARVMFEKWLEENNLDLRNLTLPQCYQFAFWLGCKNGSDRIDENAGEIIANLVSGLVDPPSVTPENLSAKAIGARKPKLDDAIRDFLDWYIGDSEVKPHRSILQGLLKDGRNDPAYNSLKGYLDKQKLGHAKLPHIHAAIKDLLDEMETKPAPAAPNNGHWTVPELTERLAALIAETPSLRGRLERYLAGYTDGKVKEDYLEAEQWVMDVIGKRSVAVNSIHEAIRNVLEARHA